MGERKMINKKGTRAISTLLIVAIIVIAVVVVGVGIYAATRGGGTTPSTSATPTPTTSTSATASPTSTSTSGIATASSYEFNLTVTDNTGAVAAQGYWAAKNLGTSNVEFMYVETTPSGGTVESIVNGVQQKAWVYSGGQWTDISSEFTSQLSTVESTAGVYVNMLKAYGGSGSFTYTAPNGAGTDTFTNVHINTSLPDSQFQPPA